MIEAALIVSRWLQFAAASILCGAPPFLLYAISARASEREAPWTWRLLQGATVVGIVAAVIMLLAQTAEMAGDAAMAFDPGTIWAVVSGTYFGTVWVVRLVLLLLAGALLFAGPPKRGAWLSLSVVGLPIAASLAWMGHGGEGDDSLAFLHRLADVVHLIAASIWIGALILLMRLLHQARRTEPEASAEAQRGLTRFSGVGPFVVALLVATGLVNAWAMTGARPVLDALKTPYALVLLIKIAFFAVMLVLAGLNRYWLTPRLDRAATDGGAARASIDALRTSILTETALAGLVIAAVAVLGTLEPPSAG